MRNFIRLLLATFLLIVPAGCSASPIALRVAMYPFVPDREAVLYRLAREFSKVRPDITLEFVDTAEYNLDYYKGGLQKLTADIYEIDTILLADMQDRLAPVDFAIAEFSPDAVNAVMRGGKAYGIPHWMCGNFLFYQKGDREIETAATWDELLKVLADRKSDLLLDLKGSSGLGEWYLTVLADRVGMDKAQDHVLHDADVADDVVGTLNQIISACPAGFCRNKVLHDSRTGFYARMFVRKGHAAYIGYSESIYFGLQDAYQNCWPANNCLGEDTIAVRRLPPFGTKGGLKGVGWVDALAIDAGLSQEKKEAALAFIAFATGADAYKAILTAADTGLLRYLLPARLNLEITSKGLYPQFYAAHTGRQTGVQPGLNDALRKKGSLLDAKLAQR